MKFTTHKVVTRDYAENLTGGVMVCGINFGFTKDEEKNEASGIVQEAEVLSFFSDQTVNNTKFRNRVLKWLRSWKIDLNGQPNKEGHLEKIYFQTNWIDSQTRDVKSEGAINNETLVKYSSGFLCLVEHRKPRIIVFVGSSLIQAFNDIRLRAGIEAVLGARSGNAQILDINADLYKGRRFKVFFQKFGETHILCLPHPQTRGLSDEYIASLILPEVVHTKLMGRNDAQ